MDTDLRITYVFAVSNEDINNATAANDLLEKSTELKFSVLLGIQELRSNYLREASTWQRRRNCHDNFDEGTVLSN